MKTLDKWSKSSFNWLLIFWKIYCLRESYSYQVITKPKNYWRDSGWESMTWAYTVKRYMHVPIIVFYFGRIKKIYKHVRIVIQVDGIKVMVRIKRKIKYHARFCGTFRLCHNCIDYSCQGTLLGICDGIRRETTSTMMLWDIHRYIQHA